MFRSREQQSHSLFFYNRILHLPVFRYIGCREWLFGLSRHELQRIQWLENKICLVEMDLKGARQWWETEHDDALRPVCIYFSSCRGEQEVKKQEIKEQEVKEQEVNEQEIEEQEVNEQEIEEQEVNEQEIEEQEVKEQEIKEQETKEQEVNEQEIKEQEVKEQEIKEKEQDQEEQQEQKQEQSLDCIESIIDGKHLLEVAGDDDDSNNKTVEAWVMEAAARKCGPHAVPLRYVWGAGRSVWDPSVRRCAMGRMAAIYYSC